MKKNFEDFRNEVSEDLREELYSRTGNEYSIEATSVKKLQDEGYEGFVVRPEDSNVGVNINVADIYSGYKRDEMTYEEAVEKIADMVVEAMNNQPGFDIEAFGNYELMKEKLALQVVSTEKNKELLETLPHKEIEDMSLVCRFIVGNSQYGMGSILVNRGMLETYNITEDQLFEDAKFFAPVIRPSEILSLADVLASMMGIEVSEFEEQMGAPGNPDIPMYVASTIDKTNGAGIIAYPGFMEMAAEKLGGDFFLLPSSIHEVLLVPDNGKSDYHDLESMVQEVNATQVEPRDWLSDHVYHYDSKEKVFELAEKFAEKTEKKDKTFIA